MRKKESELLRVTFERDLGMNLVMVDARERFLARLAGVEDPEQKRKIIGDEFIRVFEEEAAKLGRIDFLTQGTLYPDVIESATSETKAAQKIKTHHNVGGLPADLRFQLIEPLRYLFKDEVRRVGLELGLPEAMVLRQPFPGPGLAIRIIGEVTAERLDTLREADWIVIDEIKAAGLYRSLWQIVRDPDPGPVGRGDGRRPDLRQRRRHPGRHQRGRHDRRLGQAPVRRPRQDLVAHRQRGPGRQPRRLRHQLQAAGDHRVGVTGSGPTTLTDGSSNSCPRRGRICAMADQTPLRRPSQRAVCPWCSAALVPGRPTCPSCGASLESEEEPRRCPA